MGGERIGMLETALRHSVQQHVVELDAFKNAQAQYIMKYNMALAKYDEALEAQSQRIRNFEDNRDHRLEPSLSPSLSGLEKLSNHLSDEIERLWNEMRDSQKRTTEVAALGQRLESVCAQFDDLRAFLTAQAQTLVPAKSTSSSDSAHPSQCSAFSAVFKWFAVARKWQGSHYSGCFSWRSMATSREHLCPKTPDADNLEDKHANQTPVMEQGRPTCAKVEEKTTFNQGRDGLGVHAFVCVGGA